MPNPLKLLIPQFERKAINRTIIGPSRYVSKVGVGKISNTTTNYDALQLIQAYYTNEIVYACINALVDAATDPKPRVERRNSQGKFEAVRGHDLTKLLMRPNPLMDFKQYMQANIVSYEALGICYSEKVRSAAGKLRELYPLNPKTVRKSYGKDGSPVYTVANTNLFDKDMMVRTRNIFDNPDEYVSPLAVAMGSVEADSIQTLFVREYFANGGLPAGLIKTDVELTSEDIDQILDKWEHRYGAKGKRKQGLAVLDNHAEFQKIGSALDEIESEKIRKLLEVRICSVFRVPPQVAGTYIGMDRSIYNNYKEANSQFWDNKLHSMFEQWASFINFHLLPEFESIEAIENEDVRFVWDMSNVAALQDDIDSVHKRAREDFLAGGITRAEYREIIGRESTEQDKVFSVPRGIELTTPDNNPANPQGLEDGDNEKSLGLKKKIYSPNIETKAKKSFEDEIEAAIQWTYERVIELGLATYPYNKGLLDVLRKYYVGFMKDGNKDTELDVAFDVENVFIQAVLDELEQIARGIDETTFADIKNVILEGANQGFSIDTIAQNLKDRGIIQSKVRAISITTTESARAYSAGSLYAYKESGVVIGKRWLVTEPCDICNDFHQQVIGLDEKFESGDISVIHPPAHPFCKCAIMPVLE